QHRQAVAKAEANRKSVMCFLRGSTKSAGPMPGGSSPVLLAFFGFGALDALNFLGLFLKFLPLAMKPALGFGSGRRGELALFLFLGNVLANAPLLEDPGKVAGHDVEVQTAGHVIEQE